jgi:hypothetical protein
MGPVLDSTNQCSVPSFGLRPRKASLRWSICPHRLGAPKLHPAKSRIRQKNHLHNHGLIFINDRNAPYCGRDRRLSRFERFLIDQRDAGCEGPSGFMV